MKITEKQQNLTNQLLYLRDTKKMSQNNIARVVQCSSGTMSDLISGKKVFSDRLLNVIEARVKVYTSTTTDPNIITDLRQYKFVYNTAKNSQKNALFSLVVGNTGLSKSVALQQFTKENKGVYYIKIDRRYTWNQLLMAIATEMGLIEAVGKKREIKRLYTSKLMDMICNFVEQQADTPCLIIDEAEVLSYSVLKQFKNLYTATQDLMGIVICGITSVKNKIAKLSGLNPQWMPVADESNEYTTFARRIKRFVVPIISREDIQKFCEHHGIKDPKIIEIAYAKWWNYDEANFRMSLIKSGDLNIKTLTKAEIETINQM